MKMNKRFLMPTALLITAYLLSACGGALPSASVPSLDLQSGEQAALKVDAMGVAFTGVIEDINGNQWTINGQTVTVDPAVVSDNFVVGDTVKVEGNVDQTGVVIASSVEAPSLAEDTVPETSETPDPNAGLFDPSTTETPDPNSLASGQLDHSNEVIGSVDAINGNVWTINGQDYLVTNSSELQGLFQVGDTVKIEFVVGADGTLTIHSAEMASTLSGGDDSSEHNASVSKDDSSSQSGNGHDSYGDDHEDADNYEHSGSTNDTGADDTGDTPSTSTPAP